MSLDALVSRHLAMAALNAARFRSGPADGGASPSTTAPKSLRFRMGPFEFEGGSTVKGCAPLGAGGSASVPNALVKGIVVQPLPRETFRLRIKMAPWLRIPT